VPYTTEELIRGKSKLENEFDFKADSFIKEAQARIDTKLRKRYKVPLVDPVPSIIESIATNFAAGFAIEKDYSDRPEKREPYLAEVLINRAEADLQGILDEGLLDGLEGVEFIPAPSEPSGRQAIMSTTAGTSEMERALSRW
jgi:phage gp36-like protein